MTATYSYYDSHYCNTYSRRCIDGSTAGCSKCVGYCQYEGHEGFLTEKQRKAHNCIEKACFYYLPKPKTIRERKQNISDIGDLVATLLSRFEGLRPMRIEEEQSGVCLIKYITITNAYVISEIEHEVSQALGKTAKMVKLDYDFDRVTQLLLA